jgi:AGCS family alanine or glycine:cation symporter
MNFLSAIMPYVDFMLEWPLLIYVISIAILCTICLNFVQITYLKRACIETFLQDTKDKKEGELSPIAAFLNTLSTNIGNGSLVGVAIAMFGGGPGAIFWIIVFGILMMAVRFAEVYLSIWSATRDNPLHGLGGPMIYLRSVKGGYPMASLYALCTVIFGLTGGNAVQTNAIHKSIVSTWPINEYILAGSIGGLIFYIALGGSARVVKVVDFLMPLRLAVFVLGTGSILVYCWAELGTAFKIIFTNAWTPTALGTGTLGFTIIQTLRYGLSKSIFATESGLGTAGVLYGGSYGKDAVKQSLVSMISTLVSIFVCFIVGLCLVVTGAWKYPVNGPAVTIAAFSTIFGHYGGWIVSFLAASFGLGVLVPYVYITRSAWFYLTNRRYEGLFILIYGTCSIIGALATVESVWKISDVVGAGMLCINLFGVL